MSVNFMFFCCAVSRVKPHLCRAEPKATLPLVGSIFHCVLNSGSA